MPGTTPEFLDRIRAALKPQYLLERPLGAGGMATVYLAHDVKHDRPVALKLLHPELGETLSATRFVREIRFAARLTHPNILPLIDSGEADGIPFYVMPYVEGESLRVRIDRGDPIPLSEALSLTGEVADALNYAHAAGIVHRDIKPDNILLLGSHAIVADFGIARAVSVATDDDTMTGVGITVGTPAYISPEQAAGEDSLDGRSDIYSLACVLFEIICGTPPFTGKNAQSIIARRFTEPAPRLSTRLEGISPSIDDAVARALSLDPDDRPTTAADFARLLKPSRSSLAVQTEEPRRVTPRGIAQMPQPTTAETRMPSVAVLPFANLTADPANEYLSDGITEEVINALSRLRTIRVAARTSSFAFKGKREDVRMIADRLGVASILDGSVRRAGSRIRVRTELIDARSGYEIWSDQMERELDDVFAMQDDIAHDIATALKATLLGGAYTHSTSVSGAVFETYLRGRFLLKKRVEADLEQAVKHFEDASRRDEQFALAQAGLADALFVLGVYGARRANDVMPLVRDAARRALEIDPSLAEAYSTLGAEQAVHEWNWAAAEDAFRRAIALDPQYPTAHQWYALNCLVPLKRFDEAIDSAENARLLDPLSPVLRASVGVVRHFAGDLEGAAADFRRALKLEPTFAMAHYFAGNVQRDLGHIDLSIAALEKAMEHSGPSKGSPEMIGSLAQTRAKGGDIERATALRDELRNTATTRHVSNCVLAQVDLALGDRASALDHLERAADEREPELIYLGVRQSYSALAGEPRFEALRERIGLA